MRHLWQKIPHLNLRKNQHVSYGWIRSSEIFRKSVCLTENGCYGLKKKCYRILCADNDESSSIFVLTQKNNIMSVLVIKVKNEQNLSMLRQLIRVFKEKASILTDEEYRDSQFARLIEEAKDSEVVPEETVKKEFKKRGIAY